MFNPNKHFITVLLVAILVVVVVIAAWRFCLQSTESIPPIKMRETTGALPIKPDLPQNKTDTLSTDPIQYPDPLPDGLTKDEYRLIYCAIGLSLEEALKAIKIIQEKYDGTEQANYLEAVAKRYVETGVMADIPTFLNSLGSGPAFFSGGKQYMARCGKQAPLTGLAWLRDLGAVPEAKHFGYKLGSESDPNIILEAVDQSGEKNLPLEVKTALLNSAYTKLAITDFPKTAQKLLESKNISEEAVASILANCAWNAFSKTLASSIPDTLLSLPDQDKWESAYQGLIGAWATKKPQEASAWLDRHSDNPNAAAMVSKLMENWLQTDSIKASNWVNNLKATDLRDAGIREIIGFTITDSPNEALPWIEQLSDPSAKASYLDQANKLLSKKIK